MALVHPLIKTFRWARPTLGIKISQEARTGMAVPCLKSRQAKKLSVFVCFLKCILSILSVLETMIQVRERLGGLIGIRWP